MVNEGLTKIKGEKVVKVKVRGPWVKSQELLVKFTLLLFLFIYLELTKIRFFFFILEMKEELLL